MAVDDDGEQAPQQAQKRRVSKRKKKRLAHTSKFLDKLTLKLDIPMFPESVISKTVRCGFMEWTFTFFNKQIHDQPIPPRPKYQTKWLKHVKQKRTQAPLRVSRSQRDGRAPAGATMMRKRQGYLLSAVCKPDPEELVAGTESQWRVNAMISQTWKRDLTTKKRKPKWRAWIFTSQSFRHGLKHYAPLICNQSDLLIIKLLVTRIAQFDQSAFAKPTFGVSNDPSPSKVCLRSADECIYVERALVEHHSPVLEEYIKDGYGTVQGNPILIDSRFKASLTRLAFRIIASALQPRFQAINIPELLEFAKCYEISALFEIVEQRMIMKKCNKMFFKKKIELAYKYDLDTFINLTAQKIVTRSEMDRKLKLVGESQAEFKDLLKRKQEAIEKRRKEFLDSKKQKIEEKRRRNEKRRHEKRAKSGRRGLKDEFGKLKVSG